MIIKVHNIRMLQTKDLFRKVLTMPIKIKGKTLQRLMLLREQVSELPTN